MANHLQSKIDLQYLQECFTLSPDGTLCWRARPDHHFSSAASAKRVNSQRDGHAAGVIGKDGYVLVRISGTLIPAHKIVWAMTRGEWPRTEIDHRNNNRQDNQPDNLRLAERPQNMANMRPHRDNRLGVKGVVAHQGGYRARICHHHKVIDLGVFATLREADAAYQAKAKELNGEFRYDGQ